MNMLPALHEELKKCGFRVSTDTRKDVSGTVYFALKGDNFDGSAFIADALEKGAIGAVTDNKSLQSEKIFIVEDVLATLQETARIYRENFSIPVLAIGGSNGKTTTRELVREVLGVKYKVHSSKENLNNHIGLPLTILSMDPQTEIGVFEIGANHPGEHLNLLDILNPTAVLVTNNGLDHLEGFGSPEGVRKANKEIFDWAKNRNARVFVSSLHPDLMEDCEGLSRTVYPTTSIGISGSAPLTLSLDGKEYVTQMSGNYNLENVYAALGVGEYFEVDARTALEAISHYVPSAKRSQITIIGGTTFIIDCYNANPSSMKLSLESFLESAKKPRGVILGDMLELGTYAREEHEKIIEMLSQADIDVVVLLGENFKQALEGKTLVYQWFQTSEDAQKWFQTKDFSGFTFLLKGSRGLRVEKAIGM